MRLRLKRGGAHGDVYDGEVRPGRRNRSLQGGSLGVGQLPSLDEESGIMSDGGRNSLVLTHGGESGY